ncbi:hypothetical protein AB0C38_25355 [Amycolatopsis sp. NPDC048633]|uniref:hypothetical protein n=1 Tax=Amycolatopsis sp. NPDC048633 TaxID=3157095 RepID=UPI0033F41E41
MDTSQTDSALVRHPLVLRVLVVAGALFGFTLLALAVSGAANASEGSPPPDRSGLLDRAGQTVHGVLEPVEPVLKPVTGTVHAVTSQVAPVVKPVTSGLEPVLAPLTRPVLRTAEPVLSALRPVTEPVLHALSPVTSPVLQATAPVTKPVVRAIGAENVAPALTGQPAEPAPRGDTSAPPVAAAPVERIAQAGWNAPAVVKQGDAQRRQDAQAGSRHIAGEAVPDSAGVAGPMSGSGGGGLPADVSGMSGSMSAGSGGQHGGEYAVTAAGTGEPGTDRSWRAPPAGSWSLHWLQFYGNDHPS